MIVEKILADKGYDVATVAPDILVSRAVYRLVAGNIGALVVSVDGERVLGLISERDLVRGLEAHGERLLDLRVGDVMSRKVPTCQPQDQVGHVMAEMTRSRSRHLPVVQDGRLCGIVSIGDLVKHRLNEVETEKAVLRDLYIARS